ncbi:MAG: acyl-CoA dehydrogenase [Actinomycetota bacterium]|jgi:acyl-CoA dehydrogenase|nr:acyl-CoA dehydrogenase [Actinomycetota bacterium]
MTGRSASDLVRKAAKVADEVAGPAADDVDRQARFPREAVDALRGEGLLSALVPAELGGGDDDLQAVSEAVTALARHCASTAMVFAMHQIQVACMARHRGHQLLDDYMAEISAEQRLLASATTEINIGGDVRSSSCAVERDGERFTLAKTATVISYGEYADAVLTTARRDPEAPPSDQVLVLCRADEVTLEPISGWDTLGFRGTCSLGFKLTAAGDVGCILPDSFGDISAQTMLPVSHILWASVWLGLAQEAEARARKFVQKEARKNPSHPPPSALRLAELTAVLQQMTQLVRAASRQFDEQADDREALASIGFAISMNALKVAAADLVVDVVNRAIVICGMAGYREDSPFSLGRILRDAHGAQVMINNDRINANNAQMLLVHRGSE